ncbi:MAG TPA: glycogen debranching enzyme, partial [Gammaproteobacteria bacterium]|nr:glycogen debranching enzyme [Gammaproteobacteria bacterium]
RVIAYTVAGLAPDEEDLHVILNMSDEPVDAALPSIAGRRWHLALDTAQPSPRDLVARAAQRVHGAQIYRASPRSVAVLEGRSVS